MQSTDLSNFIKYCLGYINITRQKSQSLQQRFKVELSNQHFNLQNFLTKDSEATPAELINLPVFYAHDPKRVPPELIDQYQAEKALATQIEEIYNRLQNDPFTKQTVINFGYYEAELPIEIEPSADAEDVAEEDVEVIRNITDHFPLFSMTVQVDKELKGGVGRYSLRVIESEIFVNVGILEPKLGVDLYFQLLAELGKFETNGEYQLPLRGIDILTKVWHLIKAQLKLKNAHFDEDSFSLKEVRIALAPKSNFFLAEDLQKLTKVAPESLERTALNTWVSEEHLNDSGDLPTEEVLYFPFPYDKYKVQVLGLLPNKAAIVQGPPGTGKSETIANLLCHLTALGKRTLFVSQKTQALKVVKDKLKKLDVPYLFGYIPNPASPQSTEEDEIDGIASRLAALEHHLQRIQYEKGQPPKGKTKAEDKAPNLANIVKVKTQLRNSINDLLASERGYAALNKELGELAPFQMPLSGPEPFRNHFSSDAWQNLLDMRANIQKLEQTIGTFDTGQVDKEFHATLSTVPWNERHCSTALKDILVDVSRTGYDRHSKSMRNLNNGLRKLRTLRSRSKLPRELIDRLDAILDADHSRSDAVTKLSVLETHSSHYEDKAELIRKRDLVGRKLKELGLSPDSFDLLEEKVKLAGNAGAAKEKILRRYEIQKELTGIKSTASVNDLETKLRDVEKQRRDSIREMLRNRINANLWDKAQKSTFVRQITARLSKAFGKSKRAFKTFDTLRKDPTNFKTILDLVPVWIMELDDASRIIPLEPGLFDYVILDEASQCNVAYTLPTMYRAEHALFVGDSEQMRDNTIIFKSNKAFDELAHRYSIPTDLQIKASGSSVQSVLDIAKLRGFKEKPLQYHYRSPAELIGFSNKYFYRPKGKNLISLNHSYLPYKNTGRIMVIHDVDNSENDGLLQNGNIAEARAILKLFKELRKDPLTQDKSIGILSFFNSQASCLRRVFEEAGYKEDDHNFKISIIEGIQGDEKDIVMYSFVISSPEEKVRYRALTGEGGDIRGDVNMGRVNVAFSRARQQVHCFISMPWKEFPEKIWIKRYLEYVDEQGEIGDREEMQPFDSQFEEEFCAMVRQELGADCAIQNQVKSCGFRIDFVVTSKKTGKRIAIECDGPCHFKDEIDEQYGIYIESDEERQAVLQDAGWIFFRIRYSEWIKDDTAKRKCIDDLRRMLETTN